MFLTFSTSKKGCGSAHYPGIAVLGVAYSRVCSGATNNTNKSFVTACLDEIVHKKRRDLGDCGWYHFD